MLPPRNTDPYALCTKPPPSYSRPPVWEKETRRSALTLCWSRPALPQPQPQRAVPRDPATPFPRPYPPPRSDSCSLDGNASGPVFGSRQSDYQTFRHHAPRIAHRALRPGTYRLQPPEACSIAGRGGGLDSLYSEAVTLVLVNGMRIG